MHKPDGTIIRKNWIISGGVKSQHSPDVVHLKGIFLVSLTDEAPPAQTSMNEARILNDETGEQIASVELSPIEEDNWWAVATSDKKSIAFIGWGNGEDFYGSVVKVKNDSVTNTEGKFYIGNIDQYYYSAAWLKELSKFVVIAKVNNKSVVCLIDTNGVKSNFTSIQNAPITRETELAVVWNEQENQYQICYTSGTKDLTTLNISNQEISLRQINKDFISERNWPTTGIACQFVLSEEGNDLWNSNKKILIAHNDENSNDAVYYVKTVDDLTDITNKNSFLSSNEIKLYSAYPNPFNPSVNIKFSTNKQNKIRLQIYNLQGELVKYLSNNIYAPGEYDLTWYGKDERGHSVSSGVYFIRLSSDSYSILNKIVYQK